MGSSWWTPRWATRRSRAFSTSTGSRTPDSRAPTQLEDALASAGFLPQDVRWVINTHLHFDHAGGNTTQDPELVDDRRRHVRPTFANATYVVQRGELDFARRTNERTRASYLPPNFEPIAAAGRWQLLEGDVEVLPGISVRLTPGHVPFHQAVLVQSAGETAAFIADLVPTTAHLPLPWIMGYDLEPLRTLESKRALLRDAAEGGWRLVFEHDPRDRVGGAGGRGQGIRASGGGRGGGRSAGVILRQGGRLRPLSELTPRPGAASLPSS